MRSLLMLRTPTRRRPRGIAAAVSVALVSFVAACGDGGAQPSSVPASKVIEGIGTVRADSALVDMVPEDDRARGLRVVTSAPYPPWEIIEKGELKGVDVDIANAIAAKLQLTLKMESVDFQGLVPAVQAGKYDVAMAGMADSKARQKVFSFVDYAKSPGVFVVRKGNPSGLETFSDLCGHQVGIEQGSLQGNVVTNRQSICKKAGKPPVQIKEYPSTSVRLALLSGKIVAFPTNTSSALPLIKAQPDKFELMHDSEEPDGYPTKIGGEVPYVGIAVSKKHPELFRAVYAAMKALGEDGTLRKIFTKWGIAEVAVIPPLKNQARY